MRNYTATAILIILFLFSNLAACQTEKSRDHDLTDPTEELAEKPNNQTVDSSTSRNPRQIIQALYDAVNSHQYEKAYRLWGRDGKASGQTLSRFKQGYVQTAETMVFITGDVTTEGAAGSLYATVPVRVEAELKSGKQQVFTGSYVLRKRNINPDRTPNPWRIYDARLTEE